MRFKNCAGFLHGPLPHHLDHLAPFCSLHTIPLIITDEGVAEQAKSYYPDLQLLYWNCLEAPFKTVQNFDTVVYTIPRPFYNELFFIAEATHLKKLKTVWLPHGNSDKGHHSLFMEGLKDETTLLVYGQNMVDFLNLKGISKPCIPVGNYRLEYYRKYRSFYNALVDPWVPSGTKILLYAPTWQDGENPTSFFEVSQTLITELPAGYTLWIKPHPNHENDIRTEQLILRYPQVRFIRHFAPIYPVLEKTDIYVGDFSSVGYDFLAFNRPMFFFNPSQRASGDPSLALHNCGDTLDPKNIYRTLLKDPHQSHLTQRRQEIYNYTFKM